MRQKKETIVEKESAEAFLTRLSSKSVFKAGKDLLKINARICGSRDEDGGVHAIFEGKDGEIITVYGRATSKTARSHCSHCGDKPHSLCPHAFAALLYDYKYAPVRRTDIEQTEPKFQGLVTFDYKSLAETASEYEPKAQVRIDVETDFPHVPSKWEKIEFTVTMTNGNKTYRGTVSSIRQLHFNKGGLLNEKDFPLQARQIFRYLATNAEDGGTRLLLDSEQTAEFFHCLADFPLLYQAGQRIYIHKGEAEPILLVSAPKADTQKIQAAIRVNDRIVPFPVTRVITGRNGVWVGFQGEYWWVPARLDIGWLRSFFKTPEQNLPLAEAEKFIQEIRCAPMDIVRAKRYSNRIPTPEVLLDASMERDENLFILSVKFVYAGVVYEADQARLRDDGESLLYRNNRFESELINRIRYFGFKPAQRHPSIQWIHSAAMAQFSAKELPDLMKEFPTISISQKLLKLIHPPKLHAHFLYKREDQDFLYLETHFSIDQRKHKMYWKDVLPFIKNDVKGFAFDAETYVIIPDPLLVFLRKIEPMVIQVKGNEDTLRLARSNVPYWTHLGKDIVGAVPHAFWGIEYALQRPPRESEGPSITATFVGELRPYQQEGTYWLMQRFSNRFNVVLADEMGLGKTVQTLSLLAQTPHLEGVPHLIICPTSLTENWRREVKRFVPDFRVAVAEGNLRDVIWNDLASYDIVIVSYAIVRRDIQQIVQHPFSVLVLDEAQHIRNAETANAKTCKSIRSKYRLVLTGTPLENSPADLWSMFDFLHPNMLGNQHAFMQRIHDDPQQAMEGLSKQIAPLMLRRKKSEVCAELPLKTEQLLYCEMTPQQAEIYQQYLATGRRQCEEMLNHELQGKKATHFDVLATLMRLRQICCHPQLLPDVDAKEKMVSSKVELLMEMLAEAIDSDHKVLIFSQFTSMLSLLKPKLDAAQIPYEYLDGHTTDRLDHVDNFNNNPDIPVFLLSLKAGGTGLNLTSADTVILFDPWWNPAVENQAADRAHRIGQQRPVTISRLIVKNSIEERILLLKESKQKLFDELVESNTQVASSAELTAEDLAFLLAP